MKTKKLSSIFLILAFLLTACGQGTAAPAPITQAPVATQPPTYTPTQTATPYFMPLGPTYPPSPTAMPPYPTASVVQANAVAFIAENSLWVTNVDGSGERKLVDFEKNSDAWASQRLLKWSPDGKWISYISGDDLWIISPDGLAKRKIVSVRDNKIKAIRKYEWSPDGSKIAYAQVVNEKSIMIVVLLDLATGKESEISSSPVPLIITLSWTPDGKHLLLSKDNSFLLFDINAREFIEIKPKETAKENQCPSEWYDQLFWSPNGQQFALSWHGGGSYYSQYLCVHNLDGTADYGVNADEIHHSIYAIPPAWDQTGNYLYLVVRNYDDPPHPEINPDLRLVRFNIKTQKVDRLLSLTETEPYALFWNISVSPNGQLLELDKSDSGNSYSFIFVDIQSLSTTKFNLDLESPPDVFFRIEPVWTSDNKNIIFYFYRRLYSLDSQTGKATIISGDHPVKSWAVSPIATTP